MLRRPTVVAGALAPALAALVLALACPAQGTPTESGSPIADQGSSYHFRSYITAIVPPVPGLQVEVLEFADRLILRNHTGKTVTVYGYSGEPYARVQPNGTAEENVRSPAVYLNTSFYANVTVPASASAGDPPAWTVVDRTGQFEWHDHRIHWMSPVTPPEVKDPGKRTKIFDWRVPIRVGARQGAIDGVLFWVPEEGTKTPLAAIVVLVAIVLGGLAFVLVVRRRRAAGAPPRDKRPNKEAW
ncbi:MAG TPA: hypothetical protein VGY30_03530 [Solirubrobacteraceae bacterium]|jgi:hypothetical protein|nr:hypothetical protein [Solirubrobacteraceae bacterium]